MPSQNAVAENPAAMKTERRSFWRWLLDGLSTFAVWISRAGIKKEGFELLPADGRFLLVSNHRSGYDPIILLHLLKKMRMMFVSKPENFNIPIAGFLMRKSGFLAIDRDSPRKALPTIYAAAEAAKSGTPVVIYPEGTRNRTPENGLLPFHNGVFKIAKRAGVPVVVAVMQGTESVTKNMPWKRTEVSIRIAGLIDADFVDSNSDREIGARVRADMEAVLADGL